MAQSPNSRGADIVGEVQCDPTTAPAVVAPDYARLGKPVSQLEELAAGNLHGEVCEGGDSGASQYRISSTRRAKWRRSSDCTDWYAQKRLDNADIVRDAWFQQLSQALFQRTVWRRRRCSTKRLNDAVNLRLSKRHSRASVAINTDCEPVAVGFIEQIERDVLPIVGQAAVFKPTVSGLEREYPSLLYYARTTDP